MTTDMFATADYRDHAALTREVQRLPLVDADILLYPNFFSQEQADRYFAQLLAELQWTQEHMTLYGKHQAVPRLSAWYGERDCHYRYSGIDHRALPWQPVLLDIRRLLMDELSTTFTSVGYCRPTTGNQLSTCRF